MWRGLAVLVLAAAASRAEEDSASQSGARAFPPPLQLERSLVEVSAEQEARVREVAGTALPSRHVVRFVARDTQSGQPAGYAYLDTHLVRTLQETVLVALDATGHVRR